MRIGITVAPFLNVMPSHTKRKALGKGKLRGTSLKREHVNRWHIRAAKPENNLANQEPWYFSPNFALANAICAIKPSSVRSGIAFTVPHIIMRPMVTAIACS